MVIGKKKVHSNLVNRKYSFKRKDAVPKSRSRKQIKLSMEKEETFTQFHFQRGFEQIAESVSPPRAHSRAPPNLKLALQGGNPVTI